MTVLTDLDELVHRVRSKISKKYILESINAYRAKSYRAAIMSTWIAVVYDIIEKISELSDEGDLNAVKIKTDIDNAILNRNIPKMQSIEEGILDMAKNDFEFITEHEFTELKRLKYDRNQCAHPAFTSYDLLYEPSPELVRTHIVCAAKCLLIHQPVQGKSAIKQIEIDILRDSFPTDKESTFEFLHKKYLIRAKGVLIKNLIKIFTKLLLNKDSKFIDKEYKIINSLYAINKANPELYKETFKPFINKFVANIDDENLLDIFWLISTDHDNWGFLDEATKIRLKSYLHNSIELDEKDFIELYDSISRLQLVDLQDYLLAGSIRMSEIIDIRIANYKAARSYFSAERIGSEEILPIIPFMNPSHFSNLVDSVIENKNEQVKNAGDSLSIWLNIFDLIDVSEDYNEPWKRLAEYLLGNEDLEDSWWKPLIVKIEIFYGLTSANNA